METGSDYLSYVNSAKNYRINDGRRDYQKPYKDSFEKIYSKAQDSNINLSNAKEFLQNLSRGELSTLQKFTSLADSIDVSALSDEGAYNLLMHDYEKYDFNNDGTTEVGIAQSSTLIPKGMTNDVREAYIDAMNGLSDSDRMMTMMLTLDTARLMSHINGTPYEPEVIDYENLKNRVDEKLNPTGQGYTSEVAKQSIREFWELFEASYSGDESKSKNEVESKDRYSNESLLEQLRSKGALVFLAELNMEKIQEKIDEYRDMLIAQMGDSVEAMQSIDKMVEDFTKQLLEELKNSLDSNEDSKITLDTQAKIKMLLDLQKEEEVKLKKALDSVEV